MELVLAWLIWERISDTVWDSDCEGSGSLELGSSDTGPGEELAAEEAPAEEPALEETGELLSGRALISRQEVRAKAARKTARSKTAENREHFLLFFMLVFHFSVSDSRDSPAFGENGAYPEFILFFIVLFLDYGVKVCRKDFTREILPNTPNKPAWRIFPSLYGSCPGKRPEGAWGGRAGPAGNRKKYPPEGEMVATSWEGIPVFLPKGLQWDGRDGRNRQERKRTGGRRE